MPEVEEIRKQKPANKHRSQISLLGQKFTVRSEYDEGYVSKLAHFVESEMATIRKNTSAGSNSHLSLLVALNLADRLFVLEAQMCKLKEETEEMLSVALGDLDEAIEQLQGQQKNEQGPSADTGTQQIGTSV